jgi:hypothetical protein
MDRTHLYWCRLNQCIVEIGWRHDAGSDIPFCFGRDGSSNACQESHDTFIKLPDWMYWIHGIIGKVKRLKELE